MDPALSRRHAPLSAAAAACAAAVAATTAVLSVVEMRVGPWTGCIIRRMMANNMCSGSSRGSCVINSFFFFGVPNDFDFRTEVKACSGN